MRRMGALLVLLAVLLAGCAPGRQVYEATFLDVFDTVTTLRGYDVSRQAFQTRAEQVHEALLEYHRLFDIYTDSPGGLKRVNDSAGIAPVAVEPEVIALLKDCRQAYDLTDGRVNAAMGSVLSLWHDAREAGLADPDHAALPDRAALEKAAKHISFDTVQLDEEAGTVYLADPAQRLDVGAIAKGYIADRMKDYLLEHGVEILFGCECRDLILDGDLCKGVQVMLNGQETEIYADRTVVATGTPEQVADTPASYTGQYLKKLLAR